jgi:Holliday junction resolvase-like predicted endonuclease
MSEFKRKRARWGMDVAEAALRREGFLIFKREWRVPGAAEIDIWAAHPDTSRFYVVEVKTHLRQSGDSHGIISAEQLKRLQWTAAKVRGRFRLPAVPQILVVWVDPRSGSVEFFENPC